VPCAEGAAQAVRVQAATEAERRRREVVYSAVVWRHGVAVVSIHSRARRWNPVVVLDHDLAAQMQAVSTPGLFVA
jgi:hypothetical protein